ncbi:MAG: nucleotidyltransferase family protein [Lachnospiraceae bacterium]|nr:nucleotidyltransferase family protein [Lachnospiraceae bacterium]
MKITGLITEYNPFHNGHLYHLNTAREVTSSAGAVAVMSGDFTQRGLPAMTDKYARTRMALEAGVDAVLELPVRYAAGSAQYFARGAVGLIEALGCVETIVYGCEGLHALKSPSEASKSTQDDHRSRCGEDDAPANDKSADKRLLPAEEAELIRRTALLLSEEPEAYRNALAKCLKSGMSFPAARSEAAGELMPGAGAVLSSPNNILAVEYESALAMGGSRVRGVAVRRTDSGYRESGSEIRRAIREIGDGDALLRLMPRTSIDALEYRVEPDDLSQMMNYRLISLSRGELTGFEDVSEEIASRVSRLRGRCYSFDELTCELAARNIPESRARRALLHILLGIRRRTSPCTGYELPFIRVLGFRESSTVMKELKEHSRLPLVTKLADAPEEAWEDDHRAAQIYRQVIFDKYGIRLPDDYHTGPVII